jgi:RNA polymerase sigma-70 factor (ECF subfamily)
LQELRQIVQQGVEGMSEQRKKVFLLSREQGLTILEIAEQLNLSPNTVKNTLVTALQQLREHLRAHGYVFPIAVLFVLLI